MNNKLRTVFECSVCGEKHSKWQGCCNGCKTWNSLVEVVENKPSKLTTNRFTALNKASSVLSLDQVNPEMVIRKPTNIQELDRALGGGLALGSVILLGGDPGIGKSTILLQSLAQIAVNNKVLYVSGEESVEQIALRAKRLEINSHPNLRLLSEIKVENILMASNNELPEILVVDSIQTVYSENLQSAPGSVSQVRECASIFTRLAKSQNIIVIMVGHVTKDGAIAGPRVLEHIVDTVLYFEGDTHSNFRMLRSVKNRFGAINELGVFAMTDKGLREVNNPSALFLSSYKENTKGCAILVSEEGTRPLLVEVQALVDKSYAMPARRLAVGMDSYRLNLLIAIMQRHLAVHLYDQDVFINLVGGLKVTEPALDMAVVLAILSSFKNRALPNKLAVFGEIGLSGEVRPVQKGQDRIKEATKLGFTRIILPKANLTKEKLAGVELLAVESLNQVYEYCFQ